MLVRGALCRPLAKENHRGSCAPFGTLAANSYKPLCQQVLQVQTNVLNPGYKYGGCPGLTVMRHGSDSKWRILSRVVNDYAELVGITYCPAEGQPWDNRRNNGTVCSWVALTLATRPTRRSFPDQCRQVQDHLRLATTGEQPADTYLLRMS